MDYVNIKQPAETLNLTATLPNVTRYDRDLIKKIALGIGLIVIISIFWVMQQKSHVEIKEEEQLSFDHITPKLYDKSKLRDNTESGATQDQTDETINQSNNVAYYHSNTGNLTKDPVKVGEHNISLLREYFEQQALIKIIEEDDARISPIAFCMPTVDAAKLNQNVNANSLSELNNNLEANNSNNIGDHKLLKAGSIIPCVLSTAINSDLPGVVVARVREHVFDTASGKFLLIPQGAMLIGRYNNDVNFGQERVQIVFEHLDMPPTAKNSNGYSVQLEQLTGSDLSGHSGILDRVNNHYEKIAVGVSLSSLLAAVGKPTRDELFELRDSAIYRQRAVNKASENVSEIANKIADKQINQNPTITIRAGVPFNIIVAKDLSLLTI